ncbi:hypothetical protein [Leminorella grimontii]|uniref:hypothetical protein n=1 Tax=Leminorella grimontii TaxID=82981 RepID=UPI0021C47F71|nr:hypothetical protein [Leminorella grimontii]
MAYIFIDFDGYRDWIETDEEGWALRQVTIDKNGVVSVSCSEPYLAEHPVDTENDCKIITCGEFERIWEDATFSQRNEWNSAKVNYPVGARISGTIKYFYPQGTICGLAAALQGCADTTGIQSKFLYPGVQISGEVVGYDEQNMWVLLDACEVI